MKKELSRLASTISLGVGSTALAAVIGGPIGLGDYEFGD